MNTIEGFAEILRGKLNQADTSVVVSDADIVSVTSTSAAPGRSIEIRVQGPADVEVSFTVPAERGSPFEQVFVGPVAEADAVVREVALSQTVDCIWPR